MGPDPLGADLIRSLERDPCRKEPLAISINRDNGEAIQRDDDNIMLACGGAVAGRRARHFIAFSVPSGVVFDVGLHCTAGLRAFRPDKPPQSIIGICSSLLLGRRRRGCKHREKKQRFSRTGHFGPLFSIARTVTLFRCITKLCMATLAVAGRLAKLYGATY